MSLEKRPVNLHQHYHAHVYFDARTLAQARALCEAAGRQFGIGVGRVHEKPVGPHTRWSCQLSFDHRQFEKLIPWLEANRNGLSILVHGNTGDDFKDHTTYAYWLGTPVPLNLTVFNR